MKVFLHTPGKLSVPGTEQGVHEYRRRITDWQLQHVEGYPSEKTDAEAWVALDLDGKMTTTEGLHRWMKSQADRSRSSIRFLIGGKQGLDSSLVNQCDWTWSLGPLVMNQSIAALVVAEQSYRCFALRTGHPYHE